MKLNGNRLIIGVCLASLILLALCDTVAAKPPGRGLVIRSGPPAHAPAHGYRRQHLCGFDLVFDVGLGVYVAVGVTDVYYHNGYFYRCRGGVWEISLKCVTWEAAGLEKLPPGLQVKARSMIKLNGNGNSLVKLNGNGNSLVKLNGNDNGPNGNASGNAAKPTGTPAENAAKSVTGPAAAATKPNGAANAAKADSAPTTNAAKSAGTAAGNQSKPNTGTGAVANKPATRPAASPKPAGKGRK